jgi:hypothetical protein
MSLDTVSILGAVQGHAQALGIFERVLLHEPEDAPGNGITCAFWAGPGAPVSQRSGLAKTSWRIEVNGRLYLDATHEPNDDIDLLLLGALDTLVADYSGDFELGGLVALVDLLGAYGDPLSWTPGYGTHNHKLYRLITIKLPLIVDDLYTQGA